MVDAFYGLRHDAVIRRDNKDRNIGDHRAAGAHGSERLMPRSVKESDGAAVYLNGVRADMLRDAAGLAGDDVRVADIVKQRGFTVVNVTHDDDDWRSGLQVFRLILVVVYQALLNGDNDFLLDLAAKLHGDERRGVIVDNVGN